MLSKIASVIINYNEAHCIINRDKAMEMAETILQVQEEAGMLPPPDNTDVIHSNLVYCYYIDKTYGDRERVIEVENSYGKLDYSRSKLWEPEDLPVSKINTEKAIDEMLNALDNDKETKDMLTKLVPDGIKLK